MVRLALAARVELAAQVPMRSELVAPRARQAQPRQERQVRPLRNRQSALRQARAAPAQRRMRIAGPPMPSQVGMDSSFSLGQTPWFANPAARHQLNLNNQQFNQLNQAYRNSWNQYQQNLRGLGAPRAQGRVGVQNPSMAHSTRASGRLVAAFFRMIAGGRRLYLVELRSPAIIGLEWPE